MICYLFLEIKTVLNNNKKTVKICLVKKILFSQFTLCFLCKKTILNKLFFKTVVKNNNQIGLKIFSYNIFVLFYLVF